MEKGEGGRWVEPLGGVGPWFFSVAFRLFTVQVTALAEQQGALRRIAL